MSESRRLYLLFNETYWGVYDEESMPDPTGGVFPEYYYKEYAVSKDEVKEMFRKILDVSKELNKSGIIPTENNQDIIFPKLKC